MIQNYKSIALQELINYSNSFPEYTLSEILFSFLRERISGVEKTKDIKSLSDEKLYGLIEKVKDLETAELEK